MQSRNLIFYLRETPFLDFKTNWKEWKRTCFDIWKSLSFLIDSIKFLKILENEPDILHKIFFSNLITKELQQLEKFINFSICKKNVVIFLLFFYFIIRWMCNVIELRSPIFLFYIREGPDRKKTNFRKRTFYPIAYSRVPKSLLSLPIYRNCILD